MIKFAYVGRNDPSKGLPDVIETFSEISNVEAILYIFSDFYDAVPENIEKKGWVPDKDIWSSDFQYLILPMLAPETYCFVLHQGVMAKKGIIVNANNTSLTSQIESGAYLYESKSELKDIIKSIAQKNEVIAPVASLKNYQRNLWERLL